MIIKNKPRTIKLDVLQERLLQCILLDARENMIKNGEDTFEIDEILMLLS